MPALPIRIVESFSSMTKVFLVSSKTKPVRPTKVGSVDSTMFIVEPIHVLL
jgi:hypothetical protein